VPDPAVAEIDVLARVAAGLVRAAGHRRPIPRALKLGVASLDLSVDSGLDQYQRAAVLSGLGGLGAARVKALPNSADRAEQE
jgi:hypothetical protein